MYRKRGYKMRQLMIILIVGCIVSTGLSQSQITETKKYDAPQNGPIIEKVQVERDYYNEMQRSAENKKKESPNLQSGKIAVVKDMERTNQKSKYHSAASAKPKQVLNTDRPNNFGQGKEQIYSKTKNRKKLGRVKGYAPREEMKKIDIHPPVSEEVLIQALGNPKPIQKQSK
jgi:hypothetical protein